MKSPVKTAVITAGGYGTRFLPFTKVIPKELLPLGDTPTLELLVKECIEAGITKIFIIVRSDCNVIEKHFSANSPYEEYLAKNNKPDYLQKIQGTPTKSVEIIFVEEDDKLPYGNARGLFAIKDELEKIESFLLLFGDDIVLGGKSSIGGIIDKYIQSDCSAIVGVQKVPIKDVLRYGNVKIKKGTVDEVETLVQKPNRLEIVSDLVIYSQLILTSDIFLYMDEKLTAEELDAGVALSKMAKDKKVLTYKPDGKWVTIGDPVNYIKANLFQMIKNGLLEKEDIVRYIKSL